MKRIIFLKSLLAFTVVFIFSCKKNDVTPPPSPTMYKVKTLNYNPGTQNELIQNYTYDNQGRLTLITRSNGEKVEYTYETNKVNSKFTAVNGTITTTINELGANGYVTKAIHPPFTSIYEINNDGFIQRITQSGGGSTYEQRFYYHGNNILDSIRTIFNGAWATTVAYSNFSIDRLFPNAANTGLAFAGQMIKHPFGKNVVRSQLANGNITTSISYRFNEFDDKGRLVKIISESPGSNPFVETYTYY